VEVNSGSAKNELASKSKTKMYRIQGASEEYLMQKMELYAKEELQGNNRRAEDYT
jgi:hypothetical protein